MLAEFEKRRTALKKALDELERLGVNDKCPVYYVKGQLEECERLEAIYKNQNQKEVENEKTNALDPNSTDNNHPANGTC